MSQPAKWERCIYHRGQSHVGAFFDDYLSEAHRRILLIGGAGFDPRSAAVAEMIGRRAAGRTDGVFVQEQRPRPDAELVKRATDNEATLRSYLGNSQFVPLEIFAPDDAVIGGRGAVSIVSRIDVKSFTDVFVDLSALSIGVGFPIVRYLYESLSNKSTNLHVVVADEPATDAHIIATACESPTTIHGFKGKWELDSHADAAKLWMPQLSHNDKAVLDLIHTRVNPHSVCPILPFPATVPRLADQLIEHYGEQFQNPWVVDARDIIYANERSPVDLYRTILRIDDARRRVFEETGGSQIILSPVGSKALAIGGLMAALDRDFTVMYVESLAYTVDFAYVQQIRTREPSQVVHVWLNGEAYGIPNKEASL